MKAIILAAGKGTRMGDLTKNIPKPMLKVLGKNLLEHKIEALPKEINEIIFVVGYLQNVIREYFGENFGRFKITYVEQFELNGSFGAVKICKKEFKKDETFLVLMGDDIYNKTDLENLVKIDKYNNCRNRMLVSETDKQIGGRILVDENFYLKEIKEGETKSENYKNTKNLINTGAYLLESKVLDFDAVLVKEGEFGLPQTLCNSVQTDEGYKVKCYIASEWINITNKESIELAEKILSEI
jgi:NDP-sugar pyrophosphorylase family protein